ncbi:hypothetical protein SAMN06272775_0105 [Streptomyces sp. 2323.1]|uniref:hypothetical protein n=1 Tax=Streptomyces sp. 2323.1 TaxID=1938841 RepID=UPI000BB92F51|nr:hypothetical protein [Streptomyces sp. 2323.1]SOE09027.1 hypothetical protein SAMN06272775_0105 [Streptomyces sp. 2323.1]
MWLEDTTDLDYVQFAQQHRGRLEEMLRAYGPGSARAACGRYMLVSQPESLLIRERGSPASCRCTRRFLAG